MRVGTRQDGNVIISHQHRFIFIKTQKTAGTSIEQALSRIAGDDAVVTPVYPPVAGHQPRNYTVPGTVARDVRWRVRSTLHQVKGRVRNHQNAARSSAYWNHMSLREVLSVAGRERVGGYTTFTFERNPFDKVLSAWRWETKDMPTPPSLSAWLHSRRPPGRADYLRVRSLPIDFDRYSLDGTTVGVDLVGRFEHLGDDLAAIIETLGLDPGKIDLQHVKATQQDGSGPVFARADVETIANAFAREIAAFGYTPPLS